MDVKRVADLVENSGSLRVDSWAAMAGMTVVMMAIVMAVMRAGQSGGRKAVGMVGGSGYLKAAN